MNREMVRKVADAVLYEGYMLYPYRRSALKNRQRWSFGILYPPDFTEVRGGTERSFMHSECLVESSNVSSSGVAALAVELRFLHLSRRRAEESAEELEEAEARSVMLESVPLTGPGAATGGASFAPYPAAQPFRYEFQVGHERHDTPPNEHLQLQAISGVIEISAEAAGEGLCKLTMHIANTTPLEAGAERNSALLASMLSAHVILTVQSARFVSLFDPPHELASAISTLRNIGNFPVLAGEAPERDTLLCSPIILYDYPQVAPESASDFFDATEIDELLTLRVNTLTDDEKNEMRAAGGPVRELLSQTEERAREQLRRTHGTIRSLRETG